MRAGIVACGTPRDLPRDAGRRGFGGLTGGRSLNYDRRASRLVVCFGWRWNGDRAPVPGEHPHILGEQVYLCGDLLMRTPNTRLPCLDAHDLGGPFFPVSGGAAGEKGRWPEGGVHGEHNRTRSAQPGAVSK